jgi:hypothetical protein
MVRVKSLAVIVMCGTSKCILWCVGMAWSDVLVCEDGSAALGRFFGTLLILSIKDRYQFINIKHNMVGVGTGAATTATAAAARTLLIRAE